MQAMYFLIPLAIVIVVVAIAVFLWAVDSGQYDDLDRASRDILFDDDELDGRYELDGKEACHNDNATDELTKDMPKRD
jgi:cbb3-type cytochrome oxidase maturation protein|tara:strand:+ start:81 stop:314 length:234 start_codon:yes stop_codon:yes gene_type:complete